MSRIRSFLENIFRKNAPATMTFEMSKNPLIQKLFRAPDEENPGS